MVLLDLLRDLGHVPGLVPNPVVLVVLVTLSLSVEDRVDFSQEIDDAPKVVVKHNSFLSLPGL